MTNELTHRGPDDFGFLIEPKTGLALGHRRLAILDLTAAGHQPMVSASGRTVIVYNGEVYNSPSLRKELEASGSRFRSHTDTEVVLEGCERWGVARALQKMNGMFAFALWDRERGTLTLARDRLGIKPIFYGWCGGVFFFSSELQALHRHPRFKADLDRDSLTLFFRHNYIPAPHTIFSGMLKLLPGHLLTLESPDGDLTPECYWSLREVIESQGPAPLPQSVDEVDERLDVLLQDAVSSRTIADVPLGAFLSGGIDSSLIVSLMQAQSQRPVKTFTIGFCEEEYSEAEHARAVAKRLGTEHTELYVTPEEARDIIPALPTVFDEPFSDSSQIPTILVCRMAREYVTVSLSGDGGDELFGGYTRYRLSRNLWRMFGWLPPKVRRAVSRSVRVIPPAIWSRGLAWLQPATRRYVRSGDIGGRIHKLSEVIEAPNQQAAYHSLVSQWKDPASLVTRSSEPATPISDPESVAWLCEFTRQMMYLDMLTYLPDDILTKVDRASMAASLEVRVPLLDHRVVEFAWGLPSHLIHRGRNGKRPIKKVLYRYVPARLFDRPKKGFAVPIGKWLRGPLREWAEELIAEDRLKREGHLEPVLIRKKWFEHVTNRRDWSHDLWDVLMFQAWSEQWL